MAELEEEYESQLFEPKQSSHNRRAYALRKKSLAQLTTINRS